MTSARRASTGQRARSDIRGDVGVLLDLAPPFVFLEKDDWDAFSRAIRKFGVRRVSLDEATRASLFFPASDKVNSCYIAPRAALTKADGALDIYISQGFVEDIIDERLTDPSFLSALRRACGLHRIALGESFAHPIPAAAPIRTHLDNALAAHRSRFLDSGSPLQRLLKGVSAAARLFIPTGDTGASRLTDCADPLQRPRCLSAREASTLGISDKALPTQGALVFGLDRRGRRDPLVFVPVTFEAGRDAVRLLLEDRPIGFLLPAPRLAENAERSDLEVHVVDLDLPTVTPWEVAYPLVLERVSAAITAALGRNPCPIDAITLRDEGRHKALACWIEVPREAAIPSPSLNRLDRLSLAHAPLDHAPGLVPLARHVGGLGTDPALRARSGGDRSRARITHTDRKFPLDPYQAHTAAAVAALDGTWVQSVTGPPGTGKTSMMRDVICDAIAGALLEERSPSLLLAGPTTQAYENLLDAVSFSWADAPPGCERILPDSPHIGAVIPTQTRLKEELGAGEPPQLRFAAAKAHFKLHEDFVETLLPALCGKIVSDRATAQIVALLFPDSGSLPLSPKDAEKAAAAEAEWIATSARLTDEVLRRAAQGDREALDLVHWPDALSAVAAEFHGQLDAAQGKGLSERANAALDTTVRFWAFHRVHRLAQLRFIAQAHGVRADIERLSGCERVTKTDRDGLLQSIKAALACLLPVRTSTVTSLGGQAVEQFGAPADLVVVDEAGMMEPEFVPAIMAEGRRTLAVGDPYQIPPVGADRLPILGGLLTRANVDPDQVGLWAMSDIPKVPGPPAKGGNGLSVMEAMSPYRDAEGLTLRRHYRCPESIIEVSNELIYRPRGIALEARKRDPAPNPDRLPPIAAVLHEGRPAERANINPVEADAIVTAFLMHHRAILSCAKGAPSADAITLDADLERMAEAVAFISPYRQQAKLDPLEGAKRDRLAGLYAQHLPEGAEVLFEGFLPNLMMARLNALLPDQKERVREAVKATVFGTVHALQGAERPVVFLSCVADEKTQFFNRDPALINVAVTRAQAHLVIARSTAFARTDGPDTPARAIADTLRRSRVLLPERLMVVESRDKGRVVERAVPHVVKVVATQGSIGTVTGLDPNGAPQVRVAPDAPHVAAHLAEARRWLQPASEGGMGLKSLVLGTDADDAGDVIARDIMQALGLDQTEIQRRGLAVTRWPMEDPAALGALLAEDIAAARDFSLAVTGRWRATRQRARSELRTALSRAVRARLRRASPEAASVSIGTLRAMRWLEERERSGWEINADIEDADGRIFPAGFCTGPGRLRTFDDPDEAADVAARLEAAGVLSETLRAVPSPVPTRRSLYDVLTVLSWAGVPPLRAMKILQRLFEKMTAR